MTEPPKNHESELAMGSEATRRIKSVLAFLLLSTALACDHGTGTATNQDATVIALSPITGTSVPHSSSTEVTLLADGETACTIDSFEARGRCVARNGATVGVFGGEGEGPGEFRNPGRMARGESGTVGVMDPSLGRFQIFTAKGELVASVPVEQSLWAPASDHADDAIVGTHSTARMGPEVVPMFTMLLQAAALSIPSGETIETWKPAALPEINECEHRFYSFPAPAREWVFVDCAGTFSVVDAEGEIRSVQSPMWKDELPNERDVAARLASQRQSWDRQNEYIAEGYAARGRSRYVPRAFVVDSTALEEYRQSPKIYYLSRGNETIDAQNRVWMPTRADRSGHSYIDVFSLEPAYLGTVRVLDRMIDFDVLGETLVVLVEGSDLEGSRRIDWYEIPAETDG